MLIQLHFEHYRVVCRFSVTCAHITSNAGWLLMTVAMDSKTVASDLFGANRLLDSAIIWFSNF